MMWKKKKLGRSLLIVGASLVGVMILGACESLDGSRRQSGQPVAGIVGTGKEASKTGLPAQLVTASDGAGAAELASELSTVQPLVDRGTGQFIAPLVVASVDTGQNGAITLNFINTDIREVISAVLGDTLKLTYVIDPRVQGTVTIRTSQPLDAASVIPILEDVLSMNGAALIKSGETYQIIPVEGATAGFRVEPGYGIHIIPLKYASVAAVRGILEPYVPPGRVLRTDTARNVLLFTGTNAEARELEELVRVFDVDWMTGMSFAIYPLQSAEARTVAQELDRVFGQDFEGPLAGIVQFVPIERQNAILVITAQPAYLDKAATWIERLDQGLEGEGQRAYVYWVQNGNAKNLAAVLSDVYGGGRTSALPPASLAPGLVPAEITSYPDAARAALTTESLPDLATAETEETAGEPAPAQQSVAAPPEPRSEEGIPFGGGANTRIVADERNNALLIMATPSQYRRVLATLRQLDVVPLQVLIEATIAEVTLNDELKYGLQWFFNLGNSTFTLSQAASGLINPVFPGFNYIFSSDDARVVLSALTSVTDVRVISAPQLLVLDNEEARLQVGDQVPVVTQQATSVVDPDAPLVNTVEYRDTGVILEVIPHVNASGLVTLEIIQEVSDVAETITSGIDSPTIQQRQITSTVAVQTGETVALGGLIRDRHTEGVTGIPLLSEVPIVGNLFKTTTNNDDRTELLVLLTPRVIRNAQDARALTEELRRRIPSVTVLEQRLMPLQPPVPES
jgi:general secretion pathway protein D